MKARNTSYRARIVDSEIDELAASLPAIALEGPKGVGKTVTASRRASTVHALDSPKHSELAGADPSRLLEEPPPILFDEWQHLPQVWDLIRRQVDAGASPGQFLLAGSAVPTAGPVHSGAGRIVTVRIRPLSLAERSDEPSSVSMRSLLRGGRPDLTGKTSWNLEDYVDEILRSGFPGIRNQSGRALNAQLESYILRIADRDIEIEFGRRMRNPRSLRRWMAAYAAATASTTSLEKIRDAATSAQQNAPSRNAVNAYRDALERLWLLDELPAWLPTRNRLRRLAASPKHNLVDPSLAARLLGVDSAGLLSGTSAGPQVPRDGTLLGSLFESLVTQSVRVYAQAAEATEVSHLRTQGGEREVDLIVERGDGRIVAIEVKLAQSIKDEDLSSLRWLEERIGDDLIDAIVVTTGPYAYRRADGIGVVPAALLGP